MPEPAVAAQLSVRGGLAAVSFYRAAFDASVEFQVGGVDGTAELVAQLRIGSTLIWVADESPDNQNFSPETLGGGTVRMLYQCDDPHAAFDRAVAAGATPVYPVADGYDWLLGRVADPFGHHWEIGKPTVPWPPAHG